MQDNSSILQCLPSNWSKQPLFKVCTLIKDGTHGSHPRMTSGIPLLSAKNITEDGRVVWDENDSFITESEYASIHRTYVIQPLDLLLTIVGSLGRRAIVQPKSRFAVQRSVAIIRTNPQALSPSYLFHFAGGDYFQRQLTLLSNSTAQAGVYLAQLSGIEVALPPIPEQSCISGILGTIDAAIRQTELLIAKLARIKQGLVQDLLTRGIDEKGNIRNEKMHKFKDSPLGRIPDEWDVISIDSIAVHVGSGITPTGGSEVYKKEGVIFIRSQNVTFDGLLLDDVAYLDEEMHSSMKRSEVFAHDVLLNITGASIGRCCPVPEELGPANVNQHVCAIRLPHASREDAVVLSTILASHIGQSQIDRLNAGGNREGLNYEQLRAFLIPWPAPEERARSAAILAVENARIRTEETYCKKINSIKRGLMEDLLTGKVRVNHPLKQ